MSTRVVADVDRVVYAYRDDALLIVVRAPGATPFGPAFGPVRRETDGHCTTLGYRGEYTFKASSDPEWMRGGEVAIYKIWDECPPYEHECAEVRVSGAI